MKNPGTGPPRSIEGQIVISGSAARFTGAAAHITLEDVSYMDSESKLIAELILDDVSHEEGDTVIPFNLVIDDPSVIDEKHDYAIGVWIDVDASGRPGERDLFSHENYNVLTRGFGNSVNIKVS
jgi:uncharacterized lipoprotein YbaY